MQKWLAIVLACALMPMLASAQTLEFPKGAAADDEALARAVPALASRLIEVYKEPDRRKYLNNLVQLQIAAGQYQAAQASLQSLDDLPDLPGGPGARITLGTFVRAKLKESGNLKFADAYLESLDEALRPLDDLRAYGLAYALQTAPNAYRFALRNVARPLANQDRLTQEDALNLLSAWVWYSMSAQTFDAINIGTAADAARRYDIRDDVLIKTKDGHTLSAIVVLPKQAGKPMPAALTFQVETVPYGEMTNALQGAAYGYASVVADARGKRLSPDAPEYLQHEPQDTYAVIDWISKQPWSNGSVGMYGGSYNGFAQWAAAKSLHPALKTIVPIVANNPGFGLPMANNVFITANYAYPFYVLTTKTTNDKLYNDRQRWNALERNWYASGRPYREYDQVDGMPNPDLQRWLKHPSYDGYWQSLVPYKNDYARINIPVLAIDGYYDDGQTSALLYRSEHLKYNPRAEHYLVIGPYDHGGSQSRHKSPVLRGYTIDPVAQFDTTDLTFKWFDYVMRGGPKPALLEDKVNFEVMGANVWRHAPTIEAMSNSELKLYLTDAKAGDAHLLSAQKPTRAGALEQTVDFKDRTTQNNVRGGYPGQIIGTDLTGATGYKFISEPMDTPVSVNGMVSGVLDATINKKDMDFGLTLFEVMPDGRLFHLTWIVARASYANDMTRRTLLVPGNATMIPFDHTPLVSRQLSKGSRLLVLLDVNKNRNAQLNYGTGKDVSDESIADAKELLKVQWHNDSYIRVPIQRE
jgi:putative CocE/NonD family hydrolase